jgi:hypothetical protein
MINNETHKFEKFYLTKEESYIRYIIVTRHGSVFYKYDSDTYTSTFLAYTEPVKLYILPE